MLFARWSTKYRGPARTEVNCSDTHCIYDNLWYTNGRFYLLVDGPDPVVRHYLSNHAILDCDASEPSLCSHGNGVSMGIRLSGCQDSLADLESYMAVSNAGA